MTLPTFILFPNYSAIQSLWMTWTVGSNHLVV